MNTRELKIFERSSLSFALLFGSVILFLLMKFIVEGTLPQNGAIMLLVPHGLWFVFGSIKGFFQTCRKSNYA